MDTTKQQRRLAYDRLMRSYAAVGDWAYAEDRWAWLMAAHVVGQADLGLHLHSHWPVSYTHLTLPTILRV